MATIALGRTEVVKVPRRRAPRALSVVFDPSPEEIDVEIDWSGWYLTDEDDMGEGGEQEQIIWELKSALLELLRERGWKRMHIGADQFFAWLKEEPLVRVSPDVYLLDDPPPRPLPGMWQTWLDGHRAPRVAFEIVSGESWAKDYRENPLKYAQLGTIELVIFDPEAAVGSASQPERIALQLFRRQGDDSFVRVASGDVVRSQELEIWIAARTEGSVATVVLSRNSGCTDFVPTLEAARSEAEEARSEAERAKSEAESELQREHALRMRLEERISALEKG